MKSVAATMGEDSPYKKHRSERKNRGHYGPHGAEQGPHGPQGPHGEHHRRRNRVSWLDTFTTYMNEFANLAGDIDLTGDDGKPKAPETKTAGQTTETQGHPQSAQAGTESTQAPKPEANTSAHAQTQCPFSPRTTISFPEIRDAMEEYFRANYMRQTSQPQPPTQEAAPKTNAASDVDMGQGDRKAPEADDAAKTETCSASSVNDFGRDASPDKADDWTVINKEKGMYSLVRNHMMYNKMAQEFLLSTSNALDLMDTASALPAAPIGFNLPEEFQERVKITTGALYPPLNSSTAGNYSY